ncbi:MAG: hypothetical protein GX233_05830 [Erysipelothrix sp.]|nr:hypothetical protein [Erysipelothrix sp.]
MKDTLEMIRGLELENQEKIKKVNVDASIRVKRSNDEALEEIEKREYDLRMYKETLIKEVDAALAVEKSKLEEAFLKEKEKIEAIFNERHEDVLQIMIDEVFDYGNR